MSIEKKGESVIIPMGRYNELLQAESAMNAIGNKDGEISVAVSGFWGQYYTVKAITKDELVTGLSARINVLQNEVSDRNSRIKRLEIIERSFIFKLVKWAIPSLKYFSHD